jgi:hypothetical protein
MKIYFQPLKSFFHWIALQIEWVKGFLKEEGSDKASNNRLLKTAVVSAFLFPYIKNSIATQKMIDIPEMWMITILLILGIKTVDNIIAMKTGKPICAPEKKAEVTNETKS